jgi:replicative DNA helicase
VVLFINRPDFFNKDAPEEDRNKTKLIIGKQRNGPTGVLQFVFNSRWTRFEVAAPDEFSGDSFQESGG